MILLTNNFVSAAQLKAFCCIDQKFFWWTYPFKSHLKPKTTFLKGRLQKLKIHSLVKLRISSYKMRFPWSAWTNYWNTKIVHLLKGCFLMFDWRWKLNNCARKQNNPDSSFLLMWFLLMLFYINNKLEKSMSKNGDRKTARVLLQFKRFQNCCS